MTLSSEAQIIPTGSDTAQRQLAHIWEDLLGVVSIGVDQNFFDLGGDSSLAVQMFVRIEKVFKVKLPLATLYEASTIKGLARILRGEVESSGWSPLVAIQPSGFRPPFFCFHGAGGNVLIYQRLSQRMGSDQPFYGLQARGLDGSPPLTTVKEMAVLYMDEMRSVQAHGPYFLGGYCMGGTIAYEVAQQLRAGGEEIAVLALFDTMNWHKIPLTIWSKSSHACQRVVFHAASLFNLDSEDMAKFFKEKVEVLRSRIPVWRGRLQAKFSGGAGSDSMVLGKIWQTNDHACWNYIPEPYAGKVMDFRPAKQYRVFSKPGFKWDRLAQGGQQVVVLPVNPATMLVEPFVKHLAVALRTAIDDAISRSGSGQFQEAVGQGR